MSDEDPAWLDYRAKFSKVYDEANYSSPLQSAVMRSSHRLIECEFNAQDHFGRVLEVGAGTGEHLNFVKHGFSQYVLSDLDSNTLSVAQQKNAGKHDGKVLFEAQSGLKLSYAENEFDRLIATHVLEHINQPHIALKEWRRVVKDGGQMSILIPTDPGIAWRLGRHFGPRRSAIAQGIAYDYVMAREHVNSCINLLALIRHYFPVRKESWWPFPVPSVDLNLFFACHITIKK